MKKLAVILFADLAAVITIMLVVANASAASPSQIGPPVLNAGAAPKFGQLPASRLVGVEAYRQQRQDALLPVAHRLADRARSGSSDIAGVKIDADAGIVHVYRTNPDQPLRVGALPAGVTVQVHPAEFNRTTMTKAAQDVIADANLLSKQDVSIQAVGPTVDGSGIRVSVLVSGTDSAAAIDHATAILSERYGAVIGQVSGTQTMPSVDDLFFGGWRFNDYAPWYGGDRISSTTTGCSTGFAAVQGGLPAELTAAHCGGVGTTFWNGPRSDGSWRVMGNSVYSNAATDVAAIRVTSYSNYINVGSALAPTQLYVGSWASPIVGQYLCQSGSYTGEVCNLRVVDTAQYVCCWQGPLADVINIYGSGAYAAGHGDSGGPVYRRSGTTGIAEGLVHGTLTPLARSWYPAYYPDNVWCPAPEGWSPRCASGFSFAHLPGY